MSQKNSTLHPARRTKEHEAARIAGDGRLTATEAAVECFREYARERPEVVALWAFGAGFVLGWKLKLW